MTLTKHIPILLGAGIALALSACQSKSETRVAPDGKTQLTVSADGKDWTFTDTAGHELVQGYDSMTVVERHPNGQPMTFYYTKGAERHYFQYYENMTLRSRGVMMDGKRQGRWTYYHPNGLPQCEATYDSEGREDGLYTVYRDNGVPYYRGHYSHGTRTGAWEAYDTDGRLTDTRQY